ncbi:hypothetical protein D6774_03560 [Candidatus Woesearchaeota archaeon]|nr:MAG: hypothetical protein D6774_03560 [Candidatus Woesearchaeota archaeon]
MGCQQEQQDPNAASVSSQFYGGDQGLVISFVPGAPPDEVVDKGQPFGASVLIENKGDDDVAAGEYRVTLTGIDPALFSTTAAAMTQKPSEELRAAQVDASGTRIEGAKVTVDFPQGGSFEHSREISGAVTYNLKADLCYQYSSKANANLCVLEDILGTQGRADKLCEISESKDVDASGAPVKVVNFVESAASSDKISFVFTIRHVGSGSVHALGSDCSDEFSKRNKVKVTIDTGISGTLSCSGISDGSASGSTYTGTVQLLNGEREIRCTQTVNNPSDFESLAEITIDYDYRTSVSKQLRVKHIG